MNRHEVGKPERVQGNGVTEHQESVGKGLEKHVALLLGVSHAVELMACGVDAGHGAPDVAPPPRQKAGVHGLAGVQEGDGTEQDAGGEGVDPAIRSGNAPWRPLFHARVVSRVGHEFGVKGAFTRTGGAHTSCKTEKLQIKDP